MKHFRLTAWDWAVAAIVLACDVIALVSTNSLRTGIGGHALGPELLVFVSALLTVQAGCLLFRRMRPLLLLGVIACADVIIALLPRIVGDPAASFNGLAFTVMVLFAGLYARKFGLVTALGSALMVGLAKAFALSTAPEFIGLSLAGYRLVTIVSTPTVALLAFWIGFSIRSSRELTQALQEKADLLEANAAVSQQAAILEERNRIARELHDTTAHHLSAIAIQTNAARALLEVNPSAASEHLEAVSESISSALRDVRATVGKLRTPLSDAEIAKVPQPSSREIPALIAEAQRLGQSITVTGSTDRPAYRILQESLTNARKHAPDALIDVELSRDRLRVLTHGTFSHAPAGRGSVSMQERATASGASFTHGPTPEGWLVDVRWDHD